MSCRNPVMAGPWHRGRMGRRKRHPTRTTAPSYFIKCLLYNVPDQLFERKLAPTHISTMTRLKTAKLEKFRCHNGAVPLFGLATEQAFVKTLQGLWETWG